MRKIPFAYIISITLFFKFIYGSARKSVIRQFENGHNANELVENFCYSEYANTTVEMKSYEWNTIRAYLANISQPCREMLKYCRYALEEHNCMTVFDTVLTDEGALGLSFTIFNCNKILALTFLGICCSFNQNEPQFMYNNPSK